MANDDEPPVVPFETWLENPIPLLNVVDPALPGYYIPLDELSARTFELPPRTEPLAVLYNHTNNNTDQDWTTLQSILGVTPTGRTSQRLPWKVVYRLHSNSLCLCTNDPLPTPRLWQPDALIRNHLVPLLQARSQTIGQPQIIWDLGAGFGRDAVYVAQHVPQAHVVAWDHRYRRDAATTVHFGRRHGVELDCRGVHLPQTLPDDVSNVSCIYAVRYWNATLWRDLAERASPGTLLALSHFGKATPDSDWPHSHPKVVLERHQVTELLQAATPHWTILLDQVVTDSDHGRTLLQCIALRR